MKKFLLFLLFTVTTCALSNAQDRSESDARQAAEEFIKTKLSGKLKSRSLSEKTPMLRLAKTYNKINNRDKALYVYNIDSEGFMFVSGDQTLKPVLGYCETGTFNPDSIPQGLQWFIEETRKNKVDAMASAISVENRMAVAPLLKTKWNQNYPFNAVCPQYTIPNGGWDGDKPVDYIDNSPSGCGATALAQVMNYFKWPVRGKGKVTYSMELQSPESYWDLDNIKTQDGISYVELSMDFENTVFDWDNMLNDYTSQVPTQEQIDAVATLMKAAGYSIYMGYGFWESWSYASDILPALVNYFGYRSDGQFFYKNTHNHKEIEEIVYKELAAGAPILWRGGNPSGAGHMFVCDGYDGEGYYHFNWGWGGYCDGYFSLLSLVPSGAGIGGSLDGYDFDQYLLLGLRPNNGEWEPTEIKPQIETSFINEYNDMFVLWSAFTTGFMMGDNAKYFFGLEVTKPTGETSEFPFYGAFSYPIGYGLYIDQIGYSKKDISAILSDYADGIYEIRPIYWVNDSPGQYHCFYSKEFDYIEMIREGGIDAYEIKWKENPYNLKLTNVSILGDEIISNMRSVISMNIENSGDEAFYDYLDINLLKYDESTGYLNDIFYVRQPVGLLPYENTTVKFNFLATVKDKNDNSIQNNFYDYILDEGKYQLVIYDPSGVILYQSENDVVATPYNEESIEEVDGIAYLKGVNSAYVMPASYSSSNHTAADGSKIYAGDITINPTQKFSDGKERKVFCNADYLRNATNLKINATESWMTGEWVVNNYPMESLWIDNMTEIPMDAFPYLENLKSLTIGKGVKTIGSYAFFNCIALEKIDLAEVESIGSYSFNNCASAKEIIFSPKMTSIPDNAVYGNDADVLVIPEKITSIGTANFVRSYSSLNPKKPRVIFIENNQAVIDNISQAFYNDFDGKNVQNARLYVPGRFHGDYDGLVGKHNEIDVYATIEGFEDSYYVLKEGETVLHKPSITSGAENTDPVYSAVSSNEEIASVNPQSMVITALKQGETEITFTSRQHESKVHKAIVKVTDTNDIQQIGADSERIIITRIGDTLEICQAPEGVKFHVFDLNGRKLTEGTITSSSTQLRSVGNTPVIVIVGNKAYKVM